MGTRSGSERRQLSRQLTVRVSEQTYAAVVAQAGASGDELATWLRDRFDIIAADSTTGPRRRRSKRAALPLDIASLKELAGQAGQLCGAIILMLGRERLPFTRVERDELAAVHRELLALKGRMIALLVEASQ